MIEDCSSPDRGCPASMGSKASPEPREHHERPQAAPSHRTLAQRPVLGHSRDLWEPWGPRSFLGAQVLP